MTNLHAITQTAASALRSISTPVQWGGGGGNPPLRLTLALLALAAAAIAIIAADLTPPASAQSDDETTGRIVARLLDDGRVEFGWQPTGGERVLPRQRYFPANATVDRWLRSSPVEVNGAEIGRINARLLDDGRIEFAFTPTDGERIEPPARYFPTNARAGRWLRSTEITLGPPEDVAPSYTVVSAGWMHTCAIRESGELECWGDNRAGQTDAPPGTFAAASVGDRHTCAIRESGDLACWGSNEFGQTDAPDGSFRTVSTSFAHTCAIRENGEIKCWGNSAYGLNDAPDGSYTAVSTGDLHTCAIHESSGAIECWGLNEYYEFDDAGEVQLIGTGRTDAPAGRFTAVSAGAGHTCAIRESGDLACWGSNDEGQTDAPDGSYTAVSVGGVHTCAISEAGESTCWGSNSSGQTNTPDGEFTAVGAGSFHTCGLRDTGAIECWGANGSGQATPPTD